MILVTSIFNNSERWIVDILRCFDDLIKITPDIEILFIEGNSIDNTYNILQNWVKQRSKTCRLVQVDISSVIEGINIFNKPTCFTHKHNDSVDILFSDGKIDSLREERYRLVKLSSKIGYGRFEKLAMLRNISTRIGLDGNNYDYIMSIDSDVYFNGDLIVKLMQSMKNNNCDLVAPMIYIKEYREYDNTYFYDTFAFRIGGQSFIPSPPYILNVDNKWTVVEVDSVGTCYLMKGELGGVAYTGENDSEQVEFCNKLREKNKKIIVDRNIEVLHVNFEKYGMEWH